MRWNFALAALVLAGCPSPKKHIEPPPPIPVNTTPPASPEDTNPVGTPPQGAPTVEEAVQFIQEVDAGYRRVITAQSRADWINQTNITDDTDAASAEAAQVTMEFQTTAIKAALRYADLKGLPEDAARMLFLLRVSPTAPAPSDGAKRKELAETVVRMQSTYGKGTYCTDKLKKWTSKDTAAKAKGGKPCLPLGELQDVLKDPKASWDQLLDAWTGWRTISPPIKDDYAKFVQLSNEGAKEIGFADTGALWKSRYDMPPDAMEADVERLWGQVKPLYDQLHCYVRAKLHKKWGDKVPATGPIPAHVFGNMWSQEWGNIYDAVEPYPGQPSTNVDKAMKKKGIKPRKMVEIAEAFFVSLGMPELPETFWQRSLIEKPRDREVVCHASAWDLTYAGDVRIKMCTKVTEEDLTTLHHELGHNYYQLSYKDLPTLFQDGANDGFHEAIGDTIALSVTPKYMVDIGVLDKSAAKSNEKADTNELMKRALDGVAFLPFGLLIDKWRWDVFAGKTAPDRYNQAWWDLVLKYQGIAPPTPRGEDFFDPGAKYHVPANTPYLRYFLARIYQFQFHRALCKAAGHTGPLHTCSIYGNKEAGAILWKALQMGSSRPWPEVMKVLTGQGEADASAILEYFAPLQTWLEAQNKGQQCGW
jgi:peptidyl-dipeptidase A